MYCSYLTKKNILVYFLILCNLNTHFFVWPYQKKRLNCWYMFYSLTRQTDRQTGRQAGRQAGTDRQQPSVLYNLTQMEVFSSKKRISLVSTAIAMNRLTLLSHLHGFQYLE